MAEKNFIIDGWQVSPDQGELTRAGEIVRIEPKVMEVLVYFTSRPSEVITREDLERDVWRGALVGYDAVTKTIIKLRKALHDDARHPHIIATIPKKGYELIAPIQFIDEADKFNSHNVDGNKKSVNQSLRIQVGLLGLVLVSALLGFWLLTSSTNSIDNWVTETKLPTILVLPFENKVENNKHDSFVDGMTENIITDLSRLSNLLVLASSTSFKYKKQDISAQDLRKQLSVDYVLKGSVRRMKDTLNINVQLVDASTGINVWGERFNNNVNEVFAVQNELTQRLVKQLAIKITAKEAGYFSKVVPANLEAYDYFLSGQRISKQQTKSTNEAARVEYRQAIKLDPSYGRAYGAMAYTMALDYRRGWTDSPVETLDRALAMAEQATLLDSSIPQTYWVLGYVHLMRKELEAAGNVVFKAITIAPNYADGYGLLALINNSLGKPKKALEYITKGMELNPHYTWDYPYNQGRAYYMLGRYDEAIKVLEKAQARNENAVPVKLFLAASYINVGRIDDAEWTAEQLQVINPNITIAFTAKTMPITNIEYRKVFLSDLRKTGLPE